MKTKRLRTPTGSLAILNTGAGDIRVSFNDQDDAEADRAIAMLLDMQKRGYAIMVQQEDGSYLRAVAINRETKSYVVIPPKADESVAKDDEQPVKRRRQRSVEQPVRNRRAVGVARSAGGCAPRSVMALLAAARNF